MKVMVVGSGGREHAIAWKAAQSRNVDEVLCVPGNGGTYYENKCRNIDCKSIDDIVKIAKDEKVDLTIIGPENYLVDGIVDRFKKEGLNIFGPSKDAAELEGSKIFAKKFMNKYGVKTGKYEVFENSGDAIEYLKKSEYPAVIKADGLAAGKGVIIAKTFEEAEEAVHSMMDEMAFNGAGKKIIIEEYLEGREASIFAVTDGKTMIPFISSMDYKKAYDNDEGLNTGGMGSIAPNPYFTKDIEKEFIENIMNPTLKGIKAEKMDYCGIVFFGVILDKKGVYLLEYNVRLGDPETQSVLSLMKSDITDMAMYAVQGKLDEFKLEWKDECACCVNAVSGGYPEKYKKGYEITGLNEVENKAFIAGASKTDKGLVTSGGRVINVVALSKTLQEAAANAYHDIAKINFKDMYYRKDIAKIK